MLPPCILLLHPFSQMTTISTTPRAADLEAVATVFNLLHDYYGPRQRSGQRDAVDELVLTILSQNTSDRNSGRAFRLLKAQFADYHSLLNAPVQEVYEVIKGAGLGNIKAPRIQAVLAEVLRRRGAFDLTFLRDLSLADAKAWLLSLPGIGPKTAACVLCFACDMPALAVDTHVHRVAQRLALIGSKVNADLAHDLLERALPPEQVYEFHVNMILHGRQTCHAQRPNCEHCPLLAVCPWGQAALQTVP